MLAKRKVIYKFQTLYYVKEQIIYVACLLFSMHCSSTDEGIIDQISQEMQCADRKQNS